MTVGADERGGAGADHPGRRPPRRDLRAAQGPPRPVRRPDPRPISRDPAPGLGLQPRRPAAGARLPRRPGARRHGGDVRHDPGGAAPPRPQPAGAVAAGPGLPGRLRGGRPRHGDPRVQADRPGRPRRHPGQGHEEQGDSSPGRQPAAAGRRLAAGRVRRRDQGRGRREGPGADGPAQGALQCPLHEAVRRRGRGGAPVEGPRVGPGGHGADPRPPDAWEGWEDSAVHPDKLGDYLRDLRKLFEKYGYNGALYGHFGQGCVHTPDRLRPEDGRGRRALPQVPRRGGRPGRPLRRLDLGRARRRPVQGGAPAQDVRPRAGPRLRRVQGDLGPREQDEPAQGGRPYAAGREPPDGPELPPAAGRRRTSSSPTTTAASPMRPSAASAWASAARRTSGTMCPSYMVTKEEMHSTRGRAHLLFEMLQGDPLTDGWRAEPVHEALDLCLACKGCKTECPLNVDMATYKAEFLSHYYEGRLRPRHAYAMGWIYWWARLASWMPGVVNAPDQTPGLGKLLQVPGRASRPGGRCRRSPPRRSRTGGRRRPPRNAGQAAGHALARHLQQPLPPADAKAAVEVLEDAGFQVIVPGRRSAAAGRCTTSACSTRPRRCCGRSSTRSGPRSRPASPFVGLEPSCVAVFRDELRDLFPMDEDAKRLSEQLLHARRVPREEGDRLPRCRSSAARRWCTATATTRTS